MSRGRRSPREIIAEAVFHFHKAIGYCKPSLDDMAVDAISMRIAAGIDALNNLEPVLLVDLFGDEWLLMRGMHNRIAHGYALVNPGFLCRVPYRHRI